MSAIMTPEAVERELEFQYIEARARIGNLVAFALMSPEEHAALHADIERRKKGLE